MRKIFDRIENLADYAPSEEVNYLFSELVSKVTDETAGEMLSPEKCRRLQKMCALAEHELEKYWALKIADAKVNIVDFPYYKNYSDLTKLEWGALSSCTKHSRHRILFVGGGPLPMSVIILARVFGICSTVIDNDPDAVSSARAVVKTLNLERKIKVVCAEARAFENYSAFNVIFVAALVGAEKGDKEKIFRRIQSRAGRDTHIIARSSAGKRVMLYQPLPKKIYSLFRPVLEISPYNEIINSIVIFRNDRIGSVRKP